MDREQGDIGESLNYRPKSSGDASATSRPPTPVVRKRMPSSAKEEDLDVRRAILSWFSEQLNRAQPWELFVDTAKYSIPWSVQEVVKRIQTNVDRFRSNYGILFVVILTGYVMSSLELVGAIAMVAAVCVALKLHEDDETAAVWGTRLVLSKNQRLAAAALAALVPLYAADFWSAVMWSAGAIVATGMVHATLYTGLDSSKKVGNKLPDIPEEGDNMGNI
ncbi:prenylated Rab acceptor protein 1-like [Dermacentor albipictus]|uniref:prenylated Rab acceptor protein 1-like n=1 Tax=Dermacentor albipictus TaxID=60249 RepID=UPI0031FC2DF8